MRLDGLSKVYALGARERYKSLRDTISDGVTAGFRTLRHGLQRQRTDTLWALRDVTFQVQRGEVLGVIGRNGAGKSTLLKILARITEPTSGTAEIHGRVGSLLEVGTGFHPELTGRENIFLNGAILGMRRAEIRTKFDEIVAFAELDRFIDTPVKRYSSGMYMRLAFAVAAHLEPEILLVDEVLAVGDVGFQKKCLGKMEGVARAGRTVLFVSHNMGAVGSLCSRIIYLKDGQVAASGPPDDVIPKYLESERTASGSDADVPDDEQRGYTLRTQGRQMSISCGEPLSLEFEVECPGQHASATAGFVLYSLFDVPVVGGSSKVQGISGAGSSSRWHVTCALGTIPLNAGTYYASIWFGNQERDYASFSRAFSIHVESADPFGWGNKVPEAWGHFYWKSEWLFQAHDPRSTNKPSESEPENRCGMGSPEDVSAPQTSVPRS
jgi:lipopolysaccharide transport system ATP-binding protein